MMLVCRREKRKLDGNLDYKYFIQDIEIDEKEEFYIFKISAWPLEGKIICKVIHVDIQNYE